LADGNRQIFGCLPRDRVSLVFFAQPQVGTGPAFVAKKEAFTIDTPMYKLRIKEGGFSSLFVWPMGDLAACPNECIDV
jgi:hypothetical protein